MRRRVPVVVVLVATAQAYAASIGSQAVVEIIEPAVIVVETDEYGMTHLQAHGHEATTQLEDRPCGPPTAPTATAGTCRELRLMFE